MVAAQVEATEVELSRSGSVGAKAVAARLAAARRLFLDVVDFVTGQTRESTNAVFAGSVPYLMLAGHLVAGWQMARALLVAERAMVAHTDVAFMKAKISTARFYAEHAGLLKPSRACRSIWR